MIRIRTSSINFRFNFSFFASIALFMLLRQKNIALLGLLSCFLHEFGHLISCKICKVKIKEISFSYTGICIKKIVTKNITYEKELFILSSGIFINLVLSAILIFVLDANCRLFGIINLIVAVFNLLPLNSFDGLRLRELIITRNIALESIEYYNNLFRISDIILFVITLFALLLIGRFNIVFIIIPIVLILIGKFEDG
jgi:Zn-dependent protease